MSTTSTAYAGQNPSPTRPIAIDPALFRPEPVQPIDQSTRPTGPNAQTGPTSLRTPKLAS